MAFRIYTLIHSRLFFVPVSNRILFMVQVTNNSIPRECPICEGRAIVTDGEGNSYCVRCNAKDYRKIKFT